jgi:endothelin-converting enzyme
VLSVETRLAESQWPAEETRNVQKIYNLYTRAHLRSLSERIDWDSYLESSGLGEVGQVVATEPSYVTALGSLLDEIPLSDWRSYFAFRLLDGAAPYLSDAFVQAKFDFSGCLVSGLEEQPPRWQRGVRNVNALLGEAVGKLYVARHFPPEAKARMEALVVNLIDTYGEAIEELPWMTAETKARAQEKRKKFTYKIGYPEKWRDYSRLRVDPDDLVGNVKRATEFDYRRGLEKLTQEIDRSEWQMTPQTVNAYHDPTKNEIVFPAAILTPPFFNMAADDAVNYGAIGVVIGHEMGHAFDDQGRKFDGDGNLRDWWSEYDAAAYEESASTLVKQFDAFEALPGLRVNGHLTLGENIGDLTGIVIAYRAPAVLHRLRPGLALPLSGGSDAPARRLEPALAAGIPGERPSAELTGILRSVRGEGGRPHVAPARRARQDLVELSSASRPRQSLGDGRARGSTLTPFAAPEWPAAAPLGAPAPGPRRKLPGSKP